MQKSSSLFSSMTPKTLESTLAKWKAVPSLLFDSISANNSDTLHCVELARCFVREYFDEINNIDVIFPIYF